MTGDVVYLDYAATAAHRPEPVTRAVAAYLADVGATPGRGGHRLAVEAGRVALRCRRALAQLLGIPGDAGRIAFTFNATHALNTALWGVLRRGDAVVRTDLDHNAVRRPLAALERERGVDVRRIPASPDGALDLEAAARLIDGARLVVVNGASNVLGTLLPVRRLAAMARDAGALVLVDAAQTAGHVPMDIATDGVDMVALTGHKGLLGPQGTGALWVREGVEVEPLLRGGSGGDSDLEDMPAAWPDHLEAGTANAPGLAGLAAGADWLLEQGVARLHVRLTGLAARLRDGLAAVPGVRVLSPPGAGVAIVTIVAEGTGPSELAARLDRDHGVLARPGLHCAPDAHRLLGTSGAGALRFSLGWATTPEDVERAVGAVGEVVAGARRAGRGVDVGEADTDARARTARAGD